MPNPIVRIHPANVSKKGQTEERPPTPVTEAVPGVVFPYRGMELHGVPATARPVDTPAVLDENEHVEYDAEPKVIEPVPVTIVTEHTTEKRVWRIIREYASADGGRRIFVGNHAVRSVKIANTGTVTVWVSDSPNPSKTMGYPIVANGVEEWTHARDGVWYAVSDDGTTQPLAIKVEYVTE